jgi:Ferritin-like domain
MDIFKLISDIEKVDPEVYERFDSRRRVFKHLTGVGTKVATAAVPAFFASVFTKAYGQGTTLDAGIAAILNFALKLEYLEAIFYNKGLNTSGLIPAGAGLTALTTIRDDENKHVTALRGLLGSQAIAPLTEANFDYTGSKGGTRAPLFANVFSNYQTFLAVAQSFEDTGVRAYKGGAAGLMANDLILEAALNIHSVEARHASHLRTMRRGGPTVAGAGTGALPKSWITGTEGGGAGGAATAAIYGPGNAATFPAEDNVTQGGVNLQTALASLSFPASAFSEAFDEPLDATTVTNIALNFVIGNTF